MNTKIFMNVLNRIELETHLDVQLGSGFSMQLKVKNEEEEV